MNNIKPEKSKRTGFVEKWAHAEQTSAFLGITLYAVIAFCIGLLVTLKNILSNKDKDVSCKFSELDNQNLIEPII